MGIHQARSQFNMLLGKSLVESLTDGIILIIIIIIIHNHLIQINKEYCHIHDYSLCKSIMYKYIKLTHEQKVIFVDLTLLYDNFDMKIVSFNQ